MRRAATANTGLAVPQLIGKRWSVRAALVFLHRYAGLGLALFLILEGLTGSLLAFNTELDRQINPDLFARVEPGARPLSLAELCERAEALAPESAVAYMFRYEDQAMMRLRPRSGASTGTDYVQLFLDPTTGAELGRRTYGVLSEGRVNIMPFLYRLHRDLALGPTGVSVLSIVALIWTLDCFTAFLLTLPVSRRAFWRRWKPSWLVKWPAGAFRLNFDFHRAGGLWLWGMLFIFAWSSVMFDYRPVYKAVTGALFEYDVPEARMARLAPHGDAAPKLGWREAERHGAKLMAEEMGARGIETGQAHSFAYIKAFGVYSYGIHSSRDVRERNGGTGIWFDGDTGELRTVFLPTGEHSGNTVTSWLWALHFADLHGSLTYRVFVFLFGLCVVGLSGTGIYIWLKKRRGKLRRLRLA
jgi:uncharacterized iron-regulated membrane protein